jgi:hypothetical protein
MSSIGLALHRSFSKKNVSRITKNIKDVLASSAGGRGTYILSDESTPQTLCSIRNLYSLSPGPN